MPHLWNDYNRWLDASEHIPEDGKRLYWVTEDGSDIGLAVWNIQDHCWKFKYMNSIFEVKYFWPIKLDRPPNYKEKKNETD